MCSICNDKEIMKADRDIVVYNYKFDRFLKGYGFSRLKSSISEEDEKEYKNIRHLFSTEFNEKNTDRQKWLARLDSIENFIFDLNFFEENFEERFKKICDRLCENDDVNIVINNDNLIRRRIRRHRYKEYKCEEIMKIMKQMDEMRQESRRKYEDEDKADDFEMIQKVLNFFNIKEQEQKKAKKCSPTCENCD